MYKNSIFLLSFFFTFSFNLLAQTILTGKIIDLNTGLPLAEVQIQEQTQSTIYYTDFQGNFTLNFKIKKGSITFFKEGYYSKTVAFTQSQELGIIHLAIETILLNEVNLASKQHQTDYLPVVFQEIPIADFQSQIAHGELVQGFRQIPSVYTTQQGGGSGDSKISIRGFDPSQTVVSINDIPVNDMETGWVYWSNWSGLADVSKSIEIQSGMSNQLLSLPTFGGNISIDTYSEDTKSFSVFKSNFGNDSYLKNNILHHQYNSNFKSSFTAFIGRNSTDGMIQGTKSVSNTYYFDASKKFGKHVIRGSIFGAPQWHEQRSNYTYQMASLSDYLKYGKDYNYNFGYYQGKPFTWTENYFHKNLMTVKWTWDMDLTQKLETNLYASIGSGGGSYESGNTPEGIFPASYLWRISTNGMVHWDAIQDYNQGNSVILADGNDYQRNDPTNNLLYINAPFNAGLTKIAFTNKHYWVGGMVNYEKIFENTIKLQANYHYRYTNAHNFDRLADLLGANGYVTYFDQNNAGKVYQKTFPLSINSAWNLLKNPSDYDQINFHYQSKILWHTLSLGTDYEKYNWKLFINSNLSVQQNQRIDFFNYPEDNPDKTSDRITQIGYSTFVGARYTKQQHSWFINHGYLVKPNRFENLFINYKNDVNPVIKQEKALSSEFGYQFKHKKINFNFNLYHTFWKDKYISLAYENPVSHATGTAVLNGVNQQHYGIETQLKFEVSPKLAFNTMISLGNWEYSGKAYGDAYDFAHQNIGSLNLTLDHLKVGDAAQFTSFFQMEYKPADRYKGFINYQLIDQLYSKLNINQNLTEAIKLPHYQLVAIGFSADIYQSAKVKVSSNVNVQNLFNETYIAESHTNIISSTDNWKGIALDNKVFFGMSRTWSLGLSLEF